MAAGSSSIFGELIMIQMYSKKTDLGIATKGGDCLKPVTGRMKVPDPVKNRNNIYLSKTHDSLISYFNKYFEIISGDTPEKLSQAYRLRYEVYCKEGLIPGFDPEDYPDGLEHDEYDERSVHSLLVHKSSGLIAGTVRIILSDQDKIDTKFPLEKFAGDSFYTEIESLKGLSRKHLGEISRLALAPGFRRRQGENWHRYENKENSNSIIQSNNLYDTNTPMADYDHSINFQKRIFSHPILGLFVSIVQMSVEHGLKYWYAGMDHKLEKLCQNFGINFRPICPIVDYYGPCRGYLSNIQDIMDGIYYNNPEVWTLLTNNGRFFSRSKYLTAL